MARKLAGKLVPIADPKNIHPMQMYIHPPVSTTRLAGDILKGTVSNETAYWLVLTPSCDFEQKDRLHSVLLAQCVPLTSLPEYASWKADFTNTVPLKAMIGDNRQDVQSERFKFLPGTFFLPDSMVDFQKLQAVSPYVLKDMEIIASLDSPFAEAVLARFSRYFGRLGTPDIDKNVVITRLKDVVSTSLIRGKVHHKLPDSFFCPYSTGKMASEFSIIKLADLSDENLLLLRAGLRAEMRKRGIADSVGAVGEQLAIEHFRKTPGLPKLQLAPRGTKNVDALSRNGDRFSIKTICEGSKTGDHLPGVR